jgi:hypothetical protein
MASYRISLLVILKIDKLSLTYFLNDESCPTFIDFRIIVYDSNPPFSLN